uniref:Uncharacterized protein n=1 Tax=Timema douglasi TaxID=61478 RepID=A0A7R8Z8X5_TIMDO|nr:unnamed protein product [Timema douglasi]
MSQYGWKGIGLLQFRVRRLLDIGGGLLFRGPPCLLEPVSPPLLIQDTFFGLQTHCRAMGSPLVTVCVFCLLCSGHTQCSAHGQHYHDSDSDHLHPFKPPREDPTQHGEVVGGHGLEHRRRREAIHTSAKDIEEMYFIKLVFDKFGNGETMTLEGFELLLRSLGLGRLVEESFGGNVEDASSPAIMNVANVNVNNVLSEFDCYISVSAVNARVSEATTDTRHQHGNISKCWKAQDLFSSLSSHIHPSNKIPNGSKDTLSQASLSKLCPSLLYQLTAVSDKERVAGCVAMAPLQSSSHVEVEKVEETDTTLVWLYSSLSILVISLCGLLGVAVIPFMQKVFYHQLLQFLVALAVGTLCGDALLHLLPHAMSSKSESHVQSDGTDSHDLNMWKGLVAALGVVFFFFTEKCLTLVAEWRKTVQKKRKCYIYTISTPVSPRVHVMRDVEGVGMAASVGEKLCKHKYSSYPYCYGEITEVPDENHYVSEEKKLHQHSHDAQCGGGEGGKILDTAVAAVLEKTATAETECGGDCCEVKPDSDQGDINPSEAESYTVIIREHENKHHGHSHTHGHVHSPPKSMSSVAWMVIMGDGLHNFTDGMAIGAAFASNIAGGFSTSIAVFCHELPHEIGDFAVLLKAGMSAKQAVFYNLLSSVLCLFGMMLGVFLGENESASSWIFAVAGGMFLYIALVDMIPELTTSHSKEGGSLFQCLLQCLGLTSGIAIMLIIAMYEHDLKTAFTDSE